MDGPTDRQTGQWTDQLVSSRVAWPASKKKKKTETRIIGSWDPRMLYSTSPLKSYRHRTTEKRHPFDSPKTFD